LASFSTISPGIDIEFDRSTSRKSEIRELTMRRERESIIPGTATQTGTPEEAESLATNDPI